MIDKVITPDGTEQSVCVRASQTHMLRNATEQVCVCVFFTANVCVRHD